MRILMTLILALTVAMLPGSSPLYAQAAGAANLAWPDKKGSVIVFASEVVQDMAKALKFYTQALGMKQVGGFTYADGYAQDAFLVFADKPEAAKLTLVKQGRTARPPVAVNDTYTHIVVQVPSIQAVLDRVPAAGGQVTRQAHRIEETNTWLATIEDPDGRHVGLLQRD